MPAQRTPVLTGLALLIASVPSRGETNVLSFSSDPGFDAGASLIRVFGALALVFALFLGGVWIFKNWQRVVAKKRGGVQLNVVEVRSLGNKQSLVVVGYGSQRMLLGTSPTGVNLITHLPLEDGPVVPDETPETAKAPSFMAALNQVLTRKAS